ncbi:hypothetical protein GCM10027262_61710 [Nocardia tengchongensis]
MVVLARYGSIDVFIARLHALLDTPTVERPVAVVPRGRWPAPARRAHAQKADDYRSPTSPEWLKPEGRATERQSQAGQTVCVTCGLEIPPSFSEQSGHRRKRHGVTSLRHSWSVDRSPYRFPNSPTVIGRGAGTSTNRRPTPWNSGLSAH